MAWQDKPIEAIGGGILSYFDELKDMLGKNKKKKGIEVGGGIMDAATGVKSAFEEKMNWLKNNPNASNYELQLLGITPEVKSAFQEKMNWLGQNPDATQEELGVLGVNSGVNMFAPQEEYSEQVMKKLVAEATQAGLQPGTPAFRDFIMGRHSGTSDWTFNVDGKTKDYTFTGDAFPNEMAVQNMRNAHGITQNKLLNNWQDKATAQASDTNQQMFENKLNQLDQGQLDQVMKVMSPMTTEQKERFVNDVINGQVSLTGYGIQDEGQPWGELTPNFAGEGMQYNTGTTLPNLGFAGY